jgi:Holliday junction resolvase-like predicted endonuclease
MRRRNAHKEILENLVERLNRNPNYRYIKTNVEYCLKGFNGELDVITKAKNGLYVMYEVKTNHSHKSYRKACEQYERYKRASNNPDLVGIYVTPQITRRMG